MVENALEYNVFLPERPLYIRIQTLSATQLVVADTIQRCQVQVETAGAGLPNMVTKYKLLDPPTPIIEEKDGYFRVTLPLLAEDIVQLRS